LQSDTPPLAANLKPSGTTARPARRRGGDFLDWPSPRGQSGSGVPEYRPGGSSGARRAASADRFAASLFTARRSENYPGPFGIVTIPSLNERGRRSVDVELDADLGAIVLISRHPAVAAVPYRSPPGGAISDSRARALRGGGNELRHSPSTMSRSETMTSLLLAPAIAQSWIRSRSGLDLHSSPVRQAAAWRQISCSASRTQVHCRRVQCERDLPGVRTDWWGKCLTIPEAVINAAPSLRVAVDGVTATIQSGRRPAPRRRAGAVLTKGSASFLGAGPADVTVTNQPRVVRRRACLSFMTT